MKHKLLSAAISGAVVVILLNTPAFSACTCTVTGVLTLHDTCHETTLNLWVYDYENPIVPDKKVWTLKTSLDGVQNNEHFTFDPINCFFSCYAEFKIMSKEVELYRGTLPGNNSTLNVGTIYDPNRCSRKKKISEVPDPD